MKVSELKRLISKRGCRFVKNGGNHDEWENKKTGQKTTIPRHNAHEIGTGLVQQILKDLGLKKP